MLSGRSNRPLHSVDSISWTGTRRAMLNDTRAMHCGRPPCQILAASSASVKGRPMRISTRSSMSAGCASAHAPRCARSLRRPRCLAYWSCPARAASRAARRRSSRRAVRSCTTVVCGRNLWIRLSDRRSGCTFVSDRLVRPQGLSRDLSDEHLVPVRGARLRLLRAWPKTDRDHRPESRAGNRAGADSFGHSGTARARAAH